MRHEESIPPRQNHEKNDEAFDGSGHSVDNDDRTSTVHVDAIARSAECKRTTADEDGIQVGKYLLRVLHQQESDGRRKHGGNRRGAWPPVSTRRATDGPWSSNGGSSSASRRTGRIMSRNVRSPASTGSKQSATSHSAVEEWQRHMKEGDCPLDGGNVFRTELRSPVHKKRQNTHGAAQYQTRYAPSAAPESHPPPTGRAFNGGVRAGHTGRTAAVSQSMHPAGPSSRGRGGRGPRGRYVSAETEFSLEAEPWCPDLQYLPEAEKTSLELDGDAVAVHQPHETKRKNL